MYIILFIHRNEIFLWVYIKIFTLFTLLYDFLQYEIDRNLVLYLLS
jgi:hypothetical protein